MAQIVSLFRRQRVKHFDDEACADFARSAASPDDTVAMQQHLAAGCRKCEAMLKMWQSVTSVTEQELTYLPPDDQVRVAKSLLPSAAVHAQPNLSVRLVFDSVLQPTAAGFRGYVATRQLLYETDQYFIDLRLEPQRNSDRFALVGQVLDRSRRGMASHGQMVRLLRRNLPLEQTVINEFGEFQFEFRAEHGLSIAIGMDLENVILLPLYCVDGSKASAKESQ
jgi:hypothetical protein